MIKLKSELFAQLDSPHGIEKALQSAIELEHSTIPPYLYALYSLKPNENSEIGKIIRSIVEEEMLHMVLVCNILNAIGGSPEIANPQFIPKYPGPLPGGIDKQLIVGLAPFSKELVKNVFMEIEEPEKPLNFPVRAMVTAVELPKTIGQFYEAIKKRIAEAGDSIFSPEPRNQISEVLPNLIEVVNVKNAVQAIEIIVEQGEGTKEKPLDLQDELAHYYRFAEIFHGKGLIKNPKSTPETPPDKRYEYGGEPILFKDSGVFRIPTNPKAADYPSGSAQRHANDTFNYTYTNLLKTLHTAVNGAPEKITEALGLMFSLKQQAIDMMAGTTTAGVATGPTFEFTPILLD